MTPFPRYFISTEINVSIKLTQNMRFLVVKLIWGEKKKFATWQIFLSRFVWLGGADWLLPICRWLATPADCGGRRRCSDWLKAECWDTSGQDSIKWIHTSVTSAHTSGGGGGARWLVHLGGLCCYFCVTLHRWKGNEEASQWLKTVVASSVEHKLVFISFIYLFWWVSTHPTRVTVRSSATDPVGIFFFIYDFVF